MLFTPIVLHRTDPAATSSANAAASSARRAVGEVEALKLDVERLLLITESLWTILKEHHGYGDNELIRRITEIDVRDGKLDGKLAAEPPEQCPHCTRTLIRRRPFCMYCGKPVISNPFDR